MEKKISIGVLGCAAIAERSVIPAIKALDSKFELVAIASRTAEKAEKFSQRFSCEPVVGYDNLINRMDIDSLYIPLPTGLHKEWINKALNSGKHIYAEKSIAMNFADAKEMVSNAQNHRVALMEGFMFQYHSQHQIVFDLINAGEIGEIRNFSTKFGFPPLERGNFRYSETLGGGALLDAAGYTVRAAYFILGNDFTIEAATMKRDASLGTNIYGSAFMSNKKGIGASLAFGFDNQYQCMYEIWGQKGKITADRAFTPKDNYSPKIILEKGIETQIIQAPADNHFEKAFSEFYNIIEDPELRKKHYEDILLQSKSLDAIRTLSNI